MNDKKTLNDILEDYQKIENELINNDGVISEELESILNVHQAELGEKSVDAGGDAVAQDDPTQEGDETVIMETPSDGSGGSSGGGGSKVLVVGSGDTLNSYYKAQVKQKLATV